MTVSTSPIIMPSNDHHQSEQPPSTPKLSELGHRFSTGTHHYVNTTTTTGTPCTTSSNHNDRDMMSQQSNHNQLRPPPLHFEVPAQIYPYRATFNSMAASLIAVSTGFPLDSVKTRLQTYNYNSNWHCVVDTYKNEGVAGFFRGE